MISCHRGLRAGNIDRAAVICPFPRLHARVRPPACRQLRQVLVPSSLLADLKRRANQELEQQQQQGEGVQEGLQMSGEQVEDSRVEEEGPGGGAKQQQAGQAQGALRASAGVRWVSTNDALVARAMQVGVHGCM